MVSLTLTSDNLLIIGGKRGVNLGRYMFVPAGSLTFNDYTDDIIYSSFMKQFNHELNINPEDISKADLISIDCNETNTLLIFLTKLNLSRERVIYKWQSAIDKFEHELILFRAPEDLLSRDTQLMEVGKSSLHTLRKNNNLQKVILFQLLTSSYLGSFFLLSQPIMKE